MTEFDIISDILTREGGYVDDAADSGGATNFGVTAQTLGEWRHLGRDASRAEVRLLTEQEAREIYSARYVRPFRDIAYEPLRVALVDFGVLAGPLTATRALQRVLEVGDDGIVGAVTRAALASVPQRLVVYGVVAERCKHCSDLAERRPKDRRFIRGWILRAVSFLGDV